jgi:hypothetical protein
MFILPYYYQKPKISTTGFTFSTVWIFTADGGTSLWQTDEETLTEQSILEEYLEPNGFVGQSKGIFENCLIFEIDPKQTNLSDFYTWTDFLGKGQVPPQSCDVWRPFHWVSDSQEDDSWGWTSQAEQLSLGKFGSLAKIWKLLQK